MCSQDHNDYPHLMTQRFLRDYIRLCETEEEQNSLCTFSQDSAEQKLVESCQFLLEKLKCNGDQREDQERLLEFFVSLGKNAKLDLDCLQSKETSEPTIFPEIKGITGKTLKTCPASQSGNNITKYESKAQAVLEKIQAQRKDPLKKFRETASVCEKKLLELENRRSEIESLYEEFKDCKSKLQVLETSKRQLQMPLEKFENFTEVPTGSVSHHKREEILKTYMAMEKNEQELKENILEGVLYSSTERLREFVAFFKEVEDCLESSIKNLRQAFAFSRCTSLLFEDDDKKSLMCNLSEKLHKTFCIAENVVKVADTLVSQVSSSEDQVSQLNDSRMELTELWCQLIKEAWVFESEPDLQLQCKGGCFAAKSRFTLILRLLGHHVPIRKQGIRAGVILENDCSSSLEIQSLCKMKEATFFHEEDGFDTVIKWIDVDLSEYSRTAKRSKEDKYYLFFHRICVQLNCSVVEEKVALSHQIPFSCPKTLDHFMVLALLEAKCKAKFPAWELQASEAYSLGKMIQLVSTPENQVSLHKFTVDDMPHSREHNKSHKWPFYAWFSAALNTAKAFEKFVFGDKALESQKVKKLYYFLDKEGLVHLARRHQLPKATAILKISQNRVDSPTGETPMAGVNVHIWTGKEIFTCRIELEASKENKYQLWRKIMQMKIRTGNGDSLPEYLLCTDSQMLKLEQPPPVKDEKNPDGYGGQQSQQPGYTVLESSFKKLNVKEEDEGLATSTSAITSPTQTPDVTEPSASKRPTDMPPELRDIVPFDSSDAAVDSAEYYGEMFSPLGISEYEIGADGESEGWREDGNI
ncbi:uncharacterized protein LOC101851631 isoform X2 [Aplysia californica]|uniref:Uncharacterized protein LOC101851631 isoform X2 n=1 Tax=Aplysia californica TaxID=6500 RepID=A0ABM1VQ52_APLCA|nr:uncharacterized protein LOC101851631 isoform X2 [Aplysia californica]